MKRRRPRLSFDEEEDEDGGASGPEGGDGERQAAARPRRGGLLQATQLAQSGRPGAGTAAEEAARAEDLAQVVALRVALGLAPRLGQADGQPAASPSGGEEEVGDGEEGARPSPPSPPVELPSSLAKIETFAEFLRLSPAIREAAPQLPAEELTSLCETAARLRFFDRELFDQVFVHIRAKIRSRQFSVEQVTALASSLVELNAYDAEIFSAASAVLLPLVTQLSKAQRLMWLKMMAAVGHRSDEAFDFALRTMPLPGGMDVASHDDFMLCWDFVKTGGCPRGARCRWTHPREVKTSH